MKGVIFMTDIEKQIENIGYKIRVIDMLNNYVVYENKKRRSGNNLRMG